MVIQQNSQSPVSEKASWPAGVSLWEMGREPGGVGPGGSRGLRGLMEGVTWGRELESGKGQGDLWEGLGQGGGCTDPALSSEMRPRGCLGRHNHLLPGLWRKGSCLPVAAGSALQAASTQTPGLLWAFGACIQAHVCVWGGAMKVSYKQALEPSRHVSLTC